MTSRRHREHPSAGRSATQKGKISQNLDVTFMVPGLYLTKCPPHFPMGMIGLIEVGDDTSNAAAGKALQLPAKPAALLAEPLAQAGVQ